MTADRGVPYAGLAPEPQRPAPRLEHLSRHAGRTLDPDTAVRFQGQRLHATVYAGSWLLVRPTGQIEAILEALRAAADEHALDIDIDIDIDAEDEDERLVRIAREAGIGPDEPQPLLLRVELLPRWDAGPVSPPDAWPVLQSYRNRFELGRPERGAVQLNHLLTSHIDHTDPAGAGTTGTTGTTGTPYRAGAHRSTVDPDDFRSGFGLWSGTSFAAPILVGEVAQHMMSTGVLPPDDAHPAAALEGGWAALDNLVPDLPARPTGPEREDRP